MLRGGARAQASCECNTAGAHGLPSSTTGRKGPFGLWLYYLDRNLLVTWLLRGGLSAACTHLPLTCIGSLTSNIVEEYTMLVCVTPPSGLPTAGGETRVTLSPGECAVDGPWCCMVGHGATAMLCCCASGRSLQ